MSKVLPILFNTEMVQAILDGRKTITRRAVKFIEGKNPNWTGYVKDRLMLYNGKNEPCCKKVPYEIGDVLYVRETWAHGCMGRYIYKAGHEYADRLSELHQWKPSIHMPKEAARIWLKVIDVKLEHLQDIDDNGAYREGAGEKDIVYHIGARVCEFAKIWNSTIKKEDLNQFGWKVNPYVWVIEFEQITKEQACELEKK